MHRRPEIQLDVYRGPLELLLALIEQQRLDITVVSLAQVAEQYMAAVASFPEPDPDAIAEFLVIGAKLLVIKTRALLPRPPAELALDDDEDVGEQLARRLEEYRRFKQAAGELRTLEDRGRRAYTRVGQVPLPPAPPADLRVSLAELVGALDRRLRLLSQQPEPVPLPAPRIITVTEVSDRIYALLRVQRRTSFEDLLSLALTRAEVIVTLWAVLELWKRGAVAVEQENLWGPIALERGPAWGRGVMNDE